MECRRSAFIIFEPEANWGEALNLTLTKPFNFCEQTINEYLQIFTFIVKEENTSASCGPDLVIYQQKRASFMQPCVARGLTAIFRFLMMRSEFSY